jgi:predicted dehydrogenase
VASRLSQLPAWADWFLNPEWSGGAVLDLAVHDLDALNWVLGTPKTVYARGRELKPGLWNDIHAVVDYGGANGLVDGSEFMPAGYPFTCTMKVLCEGGVVEFVFRAGGVSVEMGGGSSLTVHADGKAYPLTPKPGDAYDNQAAYFVDCLRRGVRPELGTPEQGRLAVATANAARRSLETGAVVTV